VVPGLASLGDVCAEKRFQLGDCVSQRIVGATPHPPFGAGSLRPPGESARSQVKRLEKGARFRVSSRDNPSSETPELDDIHETSRTGPDPYRVTVLRRGDWLGPDGRLVTHAFILLTET
jgi:hypothetical protein